MIDFVAGVLTSFPSTGDEGIYIHTASGWTLTLDGITGTDIMDLKRTPNGRLFANSDDVNQYYTNLNGRGTSWQAGSHTQGGNNAATAFPTGASEVDVIYDSKTQRIISSTDYGLTFQTYLPYLHNTFQLAPIWASRSKVWWSESGYSSGIGTTGSTEPQWETGAIVHIFVQDNNIVWQFQRVADESKPGWTASTVIALNTEIQVTTGFGETIFKAMQVGGNQTSLILDGTQVAIMPTTGIYSVRGLYSSDTVWIFIWDTHTPVNLSRLLQYTNGFLTEITLPSLVGGLWSFVPITDSLWYIADSDGFDSFAVYRTANAGLNWSKVIEDSRLFPEAGVTVAPAFMDQIGNDAVVIALGGVFYSTDGGLTWSFVAGPSSTTEFSCIQFIASQSRRLAQATLIGAT